MATSESPIERIPEIQSTQPNLVPPSVLAELSKHPQFRQRLTLLQAEARTLVSAAIDDLSKALEPEDSTNVDKQIAVAGAALARRSRRAGLDVKARREYATRFLTAALRNRRNPDWDPTDPSTDRADPDDGIMTLLRLDLSGNLDSGLK